MAAVDSAAEIASLLSQWEKEYGTGIDAVPLLRRMAEIVEHETEAWFKQDPDPFDDRHPGRADPDCALGHVLKALFKNDNFMNRITNSYLLSREGNELHETCCRLLLDVMPGLETTIVFQDNEPLIRRLIQWAEAESEPLSSYAIGLLSGAMEVQDVAASFQDKNAVLVPMLFKRLHKLKEADEEEKTKSDDLLPARPFADIGKKSPDFKIQLAKTTEDGDSIGSEKENAKDSTKCSNIPENGLGTRKRKISKGEDGDDEKAVKLGTNVASKIHVEKSKGLLANQIAQKSPQGGINDLSNCSWVEFEQYIIGRQSFFPLTPQAQQRLIIQYLTPVGEYQEHLSHVFEHKALDLIFYYIDLSKNNNVRLAFDALKYLASLLCHKKFAVEFIQRNGVQRLLAVRRPSVAATGVSICLYYLAYFEDAMERVCLLPHTVLSEMVSYMLWLLECSHESGRCHATMFFSLSFPFRVILELFDMQDGLRKLYNVISTLAILNVEDNETSLTEDEIFTSRQAARHVTMALKKYFEAHLAIKAAQLHRTHVRNDGHSPLGEIPAYKASKFPQEVIQDNIELLLDCQPYRMRWESITRFLRLGGVTLLLQMVAMAAEWSNYTGKSETIRSALESLSICAVSPRTQLLLCEAVQLPDNTTTPAISILLGLAEGEVLTDADVMKAALGVLNNCVCGPTSPQLGGPMNRLTSGSSKKRQLMRNGEDLLHKIWEHVRSNNGIMTLLKLLMIKAPITEADTIRALACKALNGLARSDTVKQIISKLPIVNNGQLQYLMREPVLQDKRREHLQFCKYASELVLKISGKTNNMNIDASIDWIRKADIVAQTKIVYPEKELLVLIQEHLLTKGLHETAATLQREASLVRAGSPVLIHPASPHIYSTPNRTQFRAISSPTTPTTSSTLTPKPVSRSQGSQGSVTSTPATPSTIKVNIVNSKVQSTTPSTQSRLPQTKRVRQKHEASSPAILKRQQGFKPDPNNSLDKIVTEYLRKQHSVCKNPVVTCPPFSLHMTHRCPEPCHKNSAPVNLTSRMFRKSIFPRYGGSDGRKCDRKYIYSRFRPIRSYRDGEEDGCFSCVTFSGIDFGYSLQGDNRPETLNKTPFNLFLAHQSCEKYLMLGTYAGELKLYNVQSGEESAAYVCHSSPLTHCESTRDGKLVLTSSTWGSPLSALWSMDDMFDMKHSFGDDSYVEFSRQTQDRIIGTKEEKAHIYDVLTGRKLLNLYDQDKANNYTQNRATFNPTDDLVLNDGVLWDVNTGKAVHKFDKFNPNISGVFHPMGLEVIINSEVWDMRTFHLLHTVPGLDQCRIRFNHAHDIIYGAIHQFEDEDSLEEETIKSPFGSSFRTFDATDYSNIATIDVKKNIFDLCTDSSDCYLAVVESQRTPETLTEESLCRLYEVGRLKDEDDDQADDDEDTIEDEDDGEDDDDDDDDGDDLEENDNQDDNDGDGNADNGEDDDNDDSDDSDSDSDASDVMFPEDSDDDDGDDMDDILFELSDYSNL